MINKKAIFLLVLMLFCISGCGVSSKYVSYSSIKYPSKSKKTSIRLMPSHASKPHKVIGNVHITGNTFWGANWKRMYDKAKAIARKKEV